MSHEKTFEAINKLKDVEIELHRLKNALEMTNRALETKDEPVPWEQFYPDIGKPQLEQTTGNILMDSYKAMQSMKVEGPLHVVCQCDKCKAQPQRTWAGLTQEEFEKLINDAGFTRSDLLMMGACIEKIVDLVEAKLKEKNT